MIQSRLFSVALIPLVAACVSTNVDVPRDHPANPAAPTAQVASAPTSPAAAAAPVAPAAATKQADKPAAEVWTCPMHPEIAKSGPGQCPICGMNLVKRPSGKAK